MMSFSFSQETMCPLTVSVCVRLFVIRICYHTYIGVLTQCTFLGVIGTEAGVCS